MSVKLIHALEGIIILFTFLLLWTILLYENIAIYVVILLLIDMWLPLFRPLENQGAVNI